MLTLSLHDPDRLYTPRADTANHAEAVPLPRAARAASCRSLRLAAPDAGDGTLSVEDGRGKVSLQARGGVFGRLDRGTVTVWDTSPADASFPVVTGADQPEAFLVDGGVRYRGAGIRFRVIGGGFKLLVQGRGFDLSVVGKGSGFIEGDTIEPGVFSLDGADCRKNRASCELLPEPGIRFRLGAVEKTERNSILRSDSD